MKLFLSIPSEENYFRGMGRYLHRRAIDGVVPELVTWKQSKHMGPPNIDGGQSTDKGLIALSDLHPAIKNYLNMGRLEQQIKTLPELRNRGFDGNLKFQLNRNLRAISQVSAWMKHIEGQATSDQAMDSLSHLC